jgi:hypothetical protein
METEPVRAYRIRPTTEPRKGVLHTPPTEPRRTEACSVVGGRWSAVGRRLSVVESADHSGLGQRVIDAIVRPCAESSISVASRLSLVSSFFALTTHQIAALRYDPACD